MFKTIVHSLLMLLMAIGSAYGQQFTLAGRVKTDTETAVAGATVTAYSSEGKVLKFTTTDEKGQFLLQLPKQAGLKVTIRSLGFRESELVADASWFSAERTEKDFIMSPQAIALEEVVIERNDSEPDSVAIHIDSLGLSETSDLKEVLSKLPEFRLDDDGTILYRGRNIDKININGKQVFVNQNSIALQSIEKRMIDHLDVISNYQDNFKLSFEDSKETILNVQSKEDFRSILVGDIEGGYGASNKYDVNGKGLYFSGTINTFLIHSINNIGAVNLQSREMNALFSQNQIFSVLDGELINGILSQNQARARDFRSNTNATVRKENNRYRLQTVAYYLMNEREMSSGTANISDEGATLLTTRDEHFNNYRALFHNTSFDYRLKKNILVDYRLITNFVKDHTRSKGSIAAFEDNASPTMSTLASSARPNSHYILNEVGYSQKFSDRWISTVRFGLHNSGLTYPVSLSTENPIEAIGWQDAVFELNGLNLKADLKFRLDKTFIPWIGYEDKYVRESVTDGTARLERNYTQRRLQLGTGGDGFLKYLRYSINWDLLHFDASPYADFYFPYRFNLSYDRRLSSWYARGNRQYFRNDISTGITLVRNFTDVHHGESNLPYHANRMDSHSLGYDYTNLFRGVSYGFSLTHQAQHNEVQPNFNHADENGVRFFTLRVIPKSWDTRFTATGSKNLFSSNYPIKLDARLAYSYGNSPSYFGGRLTDVLHSGPSMRIGLQSLSPSWFNFELSSQSNLYKVAINENKFDNQSMANLVALNARSKGFEAKLEFVYQLDFLYGSRFDRKNIYLTLAKRRGKMTYGFKGVNLDDFFGLFNNAAYNNYVIYNQGISTVVTNDRAIRYAIFYVKYTFN